MVHHIEKLALVFCFITFNVQFNHCMDEKLLRNIRSLIGSGFHHDASKNPVQTVGNNYLNQNSDVQTVSNNHHDQNSLSAQFQGYTNNEPVQTGSHTLFNTDSLSQGIDFSEPDNDDTKRCIQKVMITEELVYDEEIVCSHNYYDECYDTFLTHMKPHQVEKCVDNYKKNCDIIMKDTAKEVQVYVCRQPLKRDCTIDGKSVCKTVDETVCESLIELHPMIQDIAQCEKEQIEMCKDVVEGNTKRNVCEKWPKNTCTIDKRNLTTVTQNSKCSAKPRLLCGSEACPIVKSPKICNHEPRTLIKKIPVETCHLSKVPSCKLDTILVPSLKPKRICVKSPEEHCVTMKLNPRLEQKPVIKHWCYTPKNDISRTPTSPEIVDLTQEASIPVQTISAKKSGSIELEESAPRVEKPYSLYHAPPMLDRQDHYVQSGGEFLSTYVEPNDEGLQYSVQYKKRRNINEALLSKTSGHSFPMNRLT